MILMIVGAIVLAGLAIFGIIVGIDYAATSGKLRDPVEGDEVALFEASGRVDITDFASVVSSGLTFLGASTDPVVDANNQWKTNLNKMMMDGGAYNGIWVTDPVCVGGASYGYIKCGASWKFNCDAVIDYMGGTGDVIGIFVKGMKEKACKTIGDKCQQQVYSNFQTAASKSS